MAFRICGSFCGMGCNAMKHAIILPMREEQVAEIARLEALCFSTPRPESALRAELSNETAVFLAAFCEGAVAGYAGMHCILDECGIDNVAVFPAYRRQGIAGALLDALEETARARDAAFLTLEVRASNAPAILLYRGKGYQEVGRRPNYYDKPQEDALLLTKYL